MVPVQRLAGPTINVSVRIKGMEKPNHSSSGMRWGEFPLVQKISLLVVFSSMLVGFCQLGVDLEISGKKQS